MPTPAQQSAVVMRGSDKERAVCTAFAASFQPSSHLVSEPVMFLLSKFKQAVGCTSSRPGQRLLWFVEVRWVAQTVV
jgi:hypothetical protein